MIMTTVIRKCTAPVLQAYLLRAKTLCSALHWHCSDNLLRQCHCPKVLARAHWPWHGHPTRCTPPKQRSWQAPALSAPGCWPHRLRTGFAPQPHPGPAAIQQRVPLRTIRFQNYMNAMTPRFCWPLFGVRGEHRSMHHVVSHARKKITGLRKIPFFVARAGRLGQLASSTRRARVLMSRAHMALMRLTSSASRGWPDGRADPSTRQRREV